MRTSTTLLVRFFAVLAIVMACTGCGDSKMRKRIAALDDATLTRILPDYEKDSKPAVLIREEIARRGLSKTPPTTAKRILNDTEESARRGLSKTPPTAERTLRNWWIAGLRLSQQQAMRFVDIRVASKDSDFLWGLNGTDKWETMHTTIPDGKTFVLAQPGLWGVDDLGDGTSATQVRFITFSLEFSKILESLSFRLKGDTDWISMADIVELDDSNNKYYVAVCLRCMAVIPRNAKSCSACQAMVKDFE